MDPWDILAWALIVLLFIIFLIYFIGGVLSLLFFFILPRVRHWRTRNIPPEKGQVWDQGGDQITIEDTYENGRFVVKLKETSWSESEASWKRRVLREKLYLISEASKSSKEPN